MDNLIDQPFGTIADLIRGHAADNPRNAALVEGDRMLDYAGLDLLMDRVAAALQRDGVRAGEAIAVCATSSIEYAAVFLGALRAGVVVAPLAPGVTPQSLAQMIANAEARLLFTDATTVDTVGPESSAGPVRIALDGSAVGKPLDAWLAPAGQPPALV
jgi:acyl-CoA synthetase (AMP-forming)/AMP-acid ligase II